MVEATVRHIKHNALAYGTDEVVSTMVNAHARVHFDGNRYSTPPRLVDQPALIRADERHVRILANGVEVARHARCYHRQQVLVLNEHRLEALHLRRHAPARNVAQMFAALGAAARQFHAELCRRPVRTTVHLRRVLRLVGLCGPQEAPTALARACEYQTYDAAYVETLVLHERRRRELPSPTEVRPRRRELLEETDLAEPDPADYDRFHDTAGEPTDG